MDHFRYVKQLWTDEMNTFRIPTSVSKNVSHVLKDQ